MTRKNEKKAKGAKARKRVYLWVVL